MEKSTSQWSALINEFQKLISRVTSAIETDDEIGTVLRLHLLIEEALDVFVQEKREGDIAVIVRQPRDFGMKLSLATAFGLPVEFGLVIRKINAIRNNLAHARSDELVDNDIRELARLANKLSNVVCGFVVLEERSLEWSQRKLAFGKHGNRIDFIIVVFALFEAYIRWNKDIIERA